MGSGSYASRLASLDFQGRFTAIHQTVPDSIAEFKAEIAKGEDTLHAFRRELIENENEREDFRATHRLKRPARTHSAAIRFLKWGFLVLLLAVETGLNGSFLAKGSEGGRIGGMSEALAFAALNVGAAFAAAALGARLFETYEAALDALAVHRRSKLWHDFLVGCSAGPNAFSPAQRRLRTARS